MKKSVALWTVIYIVVLALFLVSCAPTITSNSVTIPDDDGNTNNVSVNLFRSATSGAFYRLVDNSNNIVCYGRFSDGISCVKK